MADADFMKSNPALTNEGTTDGSGLKIEGLEAGRPYLQVRSYIYIYIAHDFKLAHPFLSLPNRTHRHVQVGEDIKKFMTSTHSKVASINRTIGQLESPYNPAPSERHKQCKTHSSVIPMFLFGTAIS